MPDLCSCGAQPPPDARFCHKCGRPLIDMPVESVPEDAPPDAPAVLAAPVQHVPPPLGFRNPVAVRVAFLAAGVSALLSTLPVVGLFAIVWWISGGFLAVYLYRRRTGQSLTVRNGARIGWITGVITFAIFSILFALSSHGLINAYREQLRNVPVHDPATLSALQNPAVIAAGLVFTLLLFFGFITLFCMSGGALGAKIVGRE